VRQLKPFATTSPLNRGCVRNTCFFTRSVYRKPVTVHQVRHVSGIALGVAFILIGVDHFLRTAWYEPIVPDVLGRPGVWVYLSGLAEVAFGAAFITSRWRARAGIFGIAMLVALYWANLNMWANDIPLNGVRYETGWHIGRLMAQTLLIGFIAWVAEIGPFSQEKTEETIGVSLQR
jgi:uncharacterized membrane protein